MKFKLFKLSLVLGLGLLSSSAWAQVTVQAPNALGNAGAWNSSTQIIVCQQSGGCDLTGSKPLQLGTGAQLSAFVNSALPPINLAVGGGGGVTGLLPASNLATGVAASNLGFTPLNPANNLSDLASVTTAQTNLGLGSLALLSTPLPYADLPALSANQLLGALTATTPSGLSVPSCSGSTNALTWASGVGFGCNTISGVWHRHGYQYRDERTAVRRPDNDDGNTVAYRAVGSHDLYGRHSADGGRDLAVCGERNHRCCIRRRHDRFADWRPKGRRHDQHDRLLHQQRAVRCRQFDGFQRHHWRHECFCGDGCRDRGFARGVRLRHDRRHIDAGEWPDRLDPDGSGLTALNH